MRQGYFCQLCNDIPQRQQKSNKCQKFTIIPKQHLKKLTPLLTLWPFTQWGIDLLVPYLCCSNKKMIRFLSLVLMARFAMNKNLIRIRKCRQIPKTFSLKTSLWVKETFKFSHGRIPESYMTLKTPYSNDTTLASKSKLSWVKSQCMQYPPKNGSCILKFNIHLVIPAKPLEGLVMLLLSEVRRSSINLGMLYLIIIISKDILHNPHLIVFISQGQVFSTTSLSSSSSS